MLVRSRLAFSKGEGGARSHTSCICRCSCETSFLHAIPSTRLFAGNLALEAKKVQLCFHTNKAISNHYQYFFSFFSPWSDVLDAESGSLRLFNHLLSVSARVCVHSIMNDYVHTSVCVFVCSCACVTCLAVDHSEAGFYLHKNKASLCGSEITICWAVTDSLVTLWRLCSSRVLDYDRWCVII